MPGTSPALPHPKTHSPTPGLVALSLLLLVLVPGVQAYIITATAGPSGTISPLGTVTVAPGASQAFTITPGSGSVIADVLVDGTSVGPVDRYTFQNVTRDHTVAASFSAAGGSVMVRSEPPGADIYLDGGYTGLTTPAFVSTDPGDHEFTLVLHGYSELTFRVMVKAGSSDVLPARQLKTGASTDLDLSTVPAGATILIDQAYRGATPLVITVPAGTYGIGLVLTGYQEYTESVTAAKGQTVTRRITLQPIGGGTGGLTVTSTPSGAALSIDGTARGVTPATVTGLTAGSHAVRLNLTGYQPYESQVAITSGQTLTKAITLVPVPTTVTSVPTTTRTTSPTTSATTTQPTTVTSTPTTNPTTSPTTSVTTTQPTTVTSIPTTTVTTVLTTTVETTPTTIAPTSTESPATPGTNLTPPPTPPGTIPLTVIVTGTTPPGVTPETRPTSPAPTGGTSTPPGFGPIPLGILSFPAILVLFGIVLIPIGFLTSHDLLGRRYKVPAGPVWQRAAAAGLYSCCLLVFLMTLVRAVSRAGMGGGEDLTAVSSVLVLGLAVVIVYLIASSVFLVIGTIGRRPLGGTQRAHTIAGVTGFLGGSLLVLAGGDAFFGPLLPFLAAAPLTAAVALWEHHRPPGEGALPHPGAPPSGDAQARPGLAGGTGRGGPTLSGEDLFPPELKEKYYEVEFLGMGGIARVFKTRSMKNGALVAVKIPISFDEATGKCFMKEIMAWEGLSHPNIVRIIEANILPIPYVEMEYVSGTLSSRPMPLPVRDAAILVRGVAEGLAYAHERGIIHRDIKPQNILLTAAGSPKITDWGMSRVMGSCLVPTVSGFSLAYAAPEQLTPTRFGDTDERTDIYQMGILFFELVTGTIPFQGDDLVNVSTAIVNDEPPFVSRLNPQAAGVDAIISRCLRKLPQERYPSVRDLIHDLDGFLSGAGPGSGE